MKEHSLWQWLVVAFIVCVFLICMTAGMHLEQVEKTKREAEKTLQMQEQTKQLELQLKFQKKE